MQELGKFNLKIIVMPNGLKKYMSFSIDNKLSFIDSFQYLTPLLDSLVQNLGKVDFKDLSQKGFYPYGYMSNFEKFKEELQKN